MMTVRTKQLRLVALLLAVAIVSAACSASAKNEPYFGKVQPPEGQVLRYISGAEPQTLDPQYMTGQPESRIAGAIFDGLVDYTEETMKPRPSLATSWDVNADGTVWTFHLRKDAKWTDGAPLNANDFVYSWRRALSPEFAAPYASLMYVVKFSEAYNNNSAFVRDPQTGKYATEGDLERAGTNSPITFTGAEPEKFDKASPASTATQAAPAEGAKAKEKYLFVPADAAERDKLANGDPAKSKPAKPELARFILGKEFLPVTKEHVGVMALDDYTFQVTLESPTAYFIKIVLHQFFRPVPRQAIEKWGDQQWVKVGHLVTSGAFKVESWQPYEKIVLVRNPTFWDNANTKLDKIIFPATEQLTTAMNLYKSGEIDCTQSNEVPPPWRNQMKETKKDYKFGPYLQIEYLAINTKLPPLNDPKVRRALSAAVNRQIIADQAPGRMPLTAFTPQMEGYQNAEGDGYNPDLARKLLAEAGFPNGKGFPEIEILYNTAESNKQTQELVQAMLKKELNIKIELTNVEWRVYLEKTRSTKMEFKGLARRGWIGDYVDPNTFLDLMTTASANNGTGWADKKYDEMLMAANAETDNEKRMGMLRDSESYMLKQQPIIPLFVGPSSFMCKPYVKNLVPNLLDQHDWRGVYIDHNITAESLGVAAVSWRSRFFGFLSR
ncbi:MAG TPA: peptide ABC transporter substrate-binding protein [Pyrinomonadaceae bacterium]|jgi:ABC-type oligopeptide transport system substrate-binding subunit